MLEAFHIKHQRDITRDRIHPPGRHRAIITINLSDFPVPFAQTSIIPETCVFNFVSVCDAEAALAVLMTRAPCNFFGTANCDYRVRVELGAEHHLSQLLFGVCSVFNASPAAACSQRPF